MGDIEAQILALGPLTIDELQTEWSRVYRAQPPIRLSRDLLLRGVAYRVQERAYGGLSLSTKRRLRTLSEGFDRQGAKGAAPTLKLSPAPSWCANGIGRCIRSAFWITGSNTRAKPTDH
jgi:hypothetical protein